MNLSPALRKRFPPAGRQRKTKLRRAGKLFSEILDRENIRLALFKALRGKRNSVAASELLIDADRNLDFVAERLSSLDPEWGNYRSFQIHDPKERTICAAAFPERVMHHAIMNVLEPFFERHLVYHSYACRKGKGSHAALLYAFNAAKAWKRYLKLDVRKYFDSIDHLVLKGAIARLIKDERVLSLLNGIIDSYSTAPGKGLPIGNLTSQHFANYYLSVLDHTIIQTLIPLSYARYMDDFVLFHDDPIFLRDAYRYILFFSDDRLKLTLKEAVVGKSEAGLPFLGFLIKSGGIFLLDKSKRRMKKRQAEIDAALRAGDIGEGKAAERAVSVNAAVLISRSRAFRVKLWAGSGLGHEPGFTRRRLRNRFASRLSLRAKPYLAPRQGRI